MGLVAFAVFLRCNTENQSVIKYSVFKNNHDKYVLNKMITKYTSND